MVWAAIGTALNSASILWALVPFALLGAVLVRHEIEHRERPLAANNCLNHPAQVPRCHPARDFLLIVFHRSAPFCSHPTELCLLVPRLPLPENGNRSERARYKGFRWKETHCGRGTSGIGKSVAQLVLKRGGSAVVVGRRDDLVGQPSRSSAASAS
jgi:hypothetical protein